LRIVSTAYVIGTMAVALPHGVRAGNRRLFDDAQEFE
jgi:hypothetical protein